MLHVDRRVPWPLVAGVLGVGLDALVTIRHFWFVVQNANDGEAGAIAYRWGGEFGFNPSLSFGDGLILTVLVRPAEGHADLRGLHEQIASFGPSVLNDATLEIRRSSLDSRFVSWGAVMDVFDVALGAGVQRLVDLPTSPLGSIDHLWGDDTTESDALYRQRVWVREHASEAEGCRLVLSWSTQGGRERAVLPPLDHPSPRPGGGRHTRAWGWTGENVLNLTEMLRPIPETDAASGPRGE